MPSAIVFRHEAGVPANSDGIYMGSVLAAIAVSGAMEEPLMILCSTPEGQVTKLILATTAQPE